MNALLFLIALLPSIVHGREKTITSDESVDILSIECQLLQLNRLKSKIEPKLKRSTIASHANATWINGMLNQVVQDIPLQWEAVRTVGGSEFVKLTMNQLKLKNPVEIQSFRGIHVTDDHKFTAGFNLSPMEGSVSVSICITKDHTTCSHTTEAIVDFAVGKTVVVWEIEALVQDKYLDGFHHIETKDSSSQKILLQLIDQLNSGAVNERELLLTEIQLLQRVHSATISQVVIEPTKLTFDIQPFGQAWYDGLSDTDPANYINRLIGRSQEQLKEILPARYKSQILSTFQDHLKHYLVQQVQTVGQLFFATDACMLKI